MLLSLLLLGDPVSAQRPQLTSTPRTLANRTTTPTPTPSKIQALNIRKSPVTYVSLSWERSHESDTLNSTSINSALTLPTYSDNVWDNGTYTPVTNKNAVPYGYNWASWQQKYSSDLRHFKATFTFPANLDPLTVQGFLFDSFYTTDIVPINDNLYVYLNGTQVFSGGTSAGAVNGGTNGTSALANETDGWYIPNAISLSGFQSGQNTIDIVTQEINNWGGLGYLMLRFGPRETTYSISGHIVYDNGNDVQGVTVLASTGTSAITDASGYYTLTNVITGTHTITPSLSGYIFAPIIRTVSVPPDAMGKDFRIRTVPNPFLDLPIAYGNFSQSANGNIGGAGTGRVNSWFDHTSPNYGINGDLTLWSGVRLTGAALTSKYTCNLGASCYDGHNGIDIQERVNDESIFAAATGTVTNTLTSCYSGVFCGGGYGNQVWIDHHNGFATRYAHLKSVSVTNGINITNVSAQPLGIMGNTGGTSIGGSGVHLHFGLYYDKNGDGQWTEDEVVDPYGWFGSGADSWSIPGGYLWKYPLYAQQSAGIAGTNITSPSGNANTIVPLGALTTTVTLQLWDSPPVAAPSAQLRSSGGTFWLRVLEWLTGNGNKPTTRKPTATLGFSQPVTVSVTYGITETQHLDTSQLVINRWDENTNTWLALPTTINNNLKTATAQTTEIGNFDLQGPLLCPADTLEIDDNYYVASTISTDGTRVSHLFDIAQDEDWHKFNAIAGKKYVVQTNNLASGVDTIVQVYDIDGVTVIATDDNGGGGKASRLIWQAPIDGTYFVRVSRASSGTFGCNATYQVSITPPTPLFLPLIRR